MTVSELIDLLREYPAGLRVVVNGYEGGYDDLAPQQISVVRIALNTGVHDWEGRHEEADLQDSRADDAAPKAETEEALVLRRTSN